MRGKLEKKIAHVPSSFYELLQSGRSLPNPESLQLLGSMSALQMRVFPRSGERVRQRAPGESCQVTASRGSVPDVEIPSFHERSGSLNTELSPLYLSQLFAKECHLQEASCPLLATVT